MQPDEFINKIEAIGMEKDKYYIIKAHFKDSPNKLDVKFYLESLKKCLNNIGLKNNILVPIFEDGTIKDIEVAEVKKDTMKYEQ